MQGYVPESELVDSMGLNFQEYWTPEDTIHFFASIGNVQKVQEKLELGTNVNLQVPINIFFL
jgi:hypothetical protein